MLSQPHHTGDQSERPLANVRAVEHRIIGKQQAPRERLVVVPSPSGLDNSLVLGFAPGQCKPHALVVNWNDPSDLALANVAEVA